MSTPLRRLSPPLHLLRAFGEVARFGSVSRAAEALHLSQPSLSRMIVRLEERGLISRSPDPTDQRAMILSLTEKGLEVQRDIGREHVKHLHELMGHALSEEEFDQLKHLSMKLRAGID